MNPMNSFDRSISHPIHMHFQALFLDFLHVSSMAVRINELLATVNADMILLVFLATVFIDMF
jgi:hypothetical protein